jgi:4'-phosphopantetheinyl transferase
MNSAVPPLEPLDLQVYYASGECAHPVRAEQCKMMLSSEERERAARFHFQEDRESYLVAHSLTRGVLAELTRTKPAELTFELGSHGRPELVQPEQPGRLRFNLSHTRGMVACAVTLEHDIGVDVERIERRVEIDSLARNVFSEAEREALDRLEPTAKRRRFFELWTLKEAYIKAVGKGLSLPLRAITLELGSGQRPSIRFDAPITDEGTEWWLDVSEPLTGFMLAVAVRARAPKLTVRKLSPPWLR